jgi:hypothetical protein
MVATDERKITYIDSENNTVTEFETPPRAGEMARREEALLVRQFESWLRTTGHEVERIRYQYPGSRAPS